MGMCSPTLLLAPNAGLLWQPTEVGALVLAHGSDYLLLCEKLPQHSVTSNNDRLVGFS